MKTKTNNELSLQNLYFHSLEELLLFNKSHQLTTYEVNYLLVIAYYLGKNEAIRETNEILKNIIEEVENEKQWRT